MLNKKHRKRPSEEDICGRSPESNVHISDQEWLTIDQMYKEAAEFGNISEKGGDQYFKLAIEARHNAAGLIK